METSFSDWFSILKKNIFLIVFIAAGIIASLVGCEPSKEYPLDPLPIYSKVVQVDSGYTKIEVISTGGSDSLFCGKKGIFDSYAIIKFDTVPENFDSLFLRFVSDTCTCELTLYKLKEEWYEDSVYLWNDIGTLIDTVNPIRTVTMYPLYDEEDETDTNSLIFLGDSLSLAESTIEAIRDYGLAVYSEPFYSFAAEKTKLKVIAEDNSDSLISSTEDAYIVNNPFRDSILSDSLLIGRGLSIRTNIFIPRDSLPPLLNKIAGSELFIEGVDTASDLRAIVSSYTAYSFFENDSMKFELGYFFKGVPDDSVFRIQIAEQNETEGIEVNPLVDIENIKIKLIWVEFP